MSCWQISQFKPVYTNDFNLKYFLMTQIHPEQTITSSDPTWINFTGNESSNGKGSVCLRVDYFVGKLLSDGDLNPDSIFHTEVKQSIRGEINKHTSSLNWKKIIDPCLSSNSKDALQHRLRSSTKQKTHFSSLSLLRPRNKSMQCMAGHYMVHMYRSPNSHRSNTTNN